MPKLFESMSYAIPGFTQGIVQGKELMGKDEDRALKRKKFDLEERQLRMVEEDRAEARRLKQEQEGARKRLAQMLLAA